MLWRSFGLVGRRRAPGQYSVCGAKVPWKTWAPARTTLLTYAIIGLCGTAQPAQAIPGPEGSNHIEQSVHLTARRPLMAHIRFCMTYEGQCNTAPDRRNPSHGRQDHWAEAMQVNFAVNRAVRPRPDTRFDTWDINLPAGDCEDYALQKRAELIARGWPTDHLRLAIVRTEWGEPHAVLLVRIGTVDYALDNLTPSVKPWDETGHDYLILQDRDDPRLWHDVSPRGGGGGTS